MGQTKKRNYDRYTLAFKLQAVKLANHTDVMAKDVAESLGIHPVMLYRWQMEHRNGELKANKHMKSSKESPKRLQQKADAVRAMEIKLKESEKKVKKLERELANRNDELDLLKKAERFFEKKK
jgi:transposase